ncbi:MAG: hypothetical protein LBS50_04405 [Prevotellaceae bacterium]|nr:hypothetical protein [Prevotellaceae bacterium]
MNFENGGTVNLGDTSNDFILKSDGGFSLSTPKESSIDFTFTLQILLIVLGGLFVGFSREKNEDEFIASIRLRSLLLAVFINYLLIIIADLLVYGLNFMVVITYNLYTMLLIHLVIFHILLWKNSKKESANEE